MECSGSATINNAAHPKHPEEEETSQNRRIGRLAKDALILLHQLEFFSNVSIESNQKLYPFLSFCFDSDYKRKHLDYQVSFGDICQQLKTGMLNLR